MARKAAGSARQSAFSAAVAPGGAADADPAAWGATAIGPEGVSEGISAREFEEARGSARAQLAEAAKARSATARPHEAMGRLGAAWLPGAAFERRFAEGVAGLGASSARDRYEHAGMAAPGENGMRRAAKSDRWRVGEKGWQLKANHTRGVLQNPWRTRRPHAQGRPMEQKTSDSLIFHAKKSKNKKKRFSVCCRARRRKHGKSQKKTNRPKAVV